MANTSKRKRTARGTFAQDMAVEEKEAGPGESRGATNGTEQPTVLETAQETTVAGVSQAGEETAASLTEHSGRETQARAPEELAAQELAQEGVAAHQDPARPSTLVELCMRVPSFRARVVSRIVQKLG